MNQQPRRRRRERSPEQSVALFNKYIVKTGARVPDIFNDSIVPGSQEADTTEEQLVLYDRRLTAKDVAVLKRYMQAKHPYLTKLHMSNNNIGVEGAEVIASLLQNNESMLQELFLNRNYLYDQGVSALAESLKTNKMLRQLKIGYNLAKDEAAKAVSEMMIVNKTLRGLEFAGNKYTLKGLGYLADAMNRNDGLSVVQVGDANNIKSRLQFVRMMIQTEDENRKRTSAILCFSKDNNNPIIDLLLEEWRVCKKEGKELINLPREKFDKFRRFNRLSDSDFEELYEGVKVFLKEAREKGVEELRQAKIILMGRSGAGKTSLAQSVIAGRSLLTGDNPDRATSSVEINKWTINGAKCTLWDFGGQEEYHLTNSYFVSPRCVVLVCLNLAEFTDTLEDYRHKVHYYIDSIQSHAPGAKFIIVGTHLNLIPRAKKRELKDSLRNMFNNVEKINLENLNLAFQRISSSKEQREEDKRSETSMEEDEGEEIEVKRLSKGSRKILSKDDLKNSSKLEIFDTPGMIVADDFEIEVGKPNPKKVISKGPKKMKASYALLGSHNDTLNAISPTAAKEAIKQEMLDKIQKQRDKSNRPHLLNICFVSSDVGIKGVKEFKDVLEDALVHNHEELDLSVALPSNYAALYEKLTGETLILTNPKIENYNIGTSKLKQIESRISTMTKTARKRKKKEKLKNVKADNEFQELLKATKAPILNLSTLYEHFVNQNVGNSKRSKRKQSRNKRGKKLFNSTSDLHNALQSLHEIGYILWYRENEVLKDVVFVDPLWVVQMIKSIIRHDMFETAEGEGFISSIEKPVDIPGEVFSLMKTSFQEEAVLDSRLLFSFEIWKDADKNERFHMISLLESFDILCEEARNTERDLHPKYFIPLYVKGKFSENTNTNVMRKLEALEVDVLTNVSNVPESLRALFFDEDPESLMAMHDSSRGVNPNDENGKSNQTTFFEGNAIRPKNIQWRYEFNNFLPEGLFLRLLVRCYPFISFYKEYRPTDSFLVGKAALDVTIIIQIEQNQYGLAGALVLTAIQGEDSVVDTESVINNMRDIWQVFSLFTFEIEDLLNSFPGLESSVLVNVVHEGVGKVSIPRLELETREVMHNSNPKKEYKDITICIGPKSIPMHYLIPPLFVLPRKPPGTPNINFTTPELVRLSPIARIEYGLIALEAQVGDEVAGKRSRVHILHKQLVKYVDILLKFLAQHIAHSTRKNIIMNFEESIQFLKNQNVLEAELESNILAMREREKSSFLYPNNRITVGHLRESIRLSWEIFNVLENKFSAVLPSRRRQNLTF